MTFYIFTGNIGSYVQFLPIFASLRKYVTHTMSGQVCIEHAYVIDHPGELLAFDFSKIIDQAKYASMIMSNEMS